MDACEVDQFVERENAIAEYQIRAGNELLPGLLSEGKGHYDSSDGRNAFLQSRVSVPQCAKNESSIDRVRGLTIEQAP
jgi:hypothetical protein